MQESQKTKTERKARAPKRVFVKLRVYGTANVNGKARRAIIKDEEGNIENQNQIVSLEYGTQQFNSYIEQLPRSPWFKAEIENVSDENGKPVAESAIPEGLVKAVKEAFEVKAK